MYETFFNLQEPPFSITPDPRFLYLGRHHREALAHLLYSIQGSSGFILLTGEVGAGKTSLSRCLIQQIPDHVDIALIFNPKLSALELVASICDELAIPRPETTSIKTLIDGLNRHLLDGYAKKRTTVLIVDEAQSLSIDLLEQIRLLSNLETDRTKLLQIVLIGQPELVTIMAKQELRQFSQRITARYHITSLGLIETGSLIRYRLSVAGCVQPIFSFWAILVIHYAAQGIPRLINQMCDRALLAAYTLERHHVNMWLAYTATREVMGRPLPRRRRNWLLFALLLLGLVTGTPLFQDVSTGGDRLKSFLESAITTWTAPASLQQQEVSASRTTQSDKPDVVAAPPEAPSVSKPETVISGTTVEESPPPSTVATSGMDKQSLGVAQPITLEMFNNLTKELAALHEKLDIATNKPVPTSPSQATAAIEKSEMGLDAHNMILNTFFNTLKEETNNPNKAMQNLLSIWGISTEQSARNPTCELAESVGLMCANLVGNWNTVRQLGLPAIIKFAYFDKNPRYALVTALGQDKITLRFAHKEETMPLREAERYWFGQATVLWRPMPGKQPLLRLGMKGAGVVWLRSRLQQLQKTDLKSEVPDLFDAVLEKHLRQFQDQVFLSADGMLGWRSVIAVDLASNDPSRPTPRLRRIVSDGGS